MVKIEIHVCLSRSRYIAGTILSTISFLFIFQECLFCQWFDSDSPALLTTYYILFPSLFNIGWASIQVAHMSLVPSLTLSRRQRDQLNALRNTFTYIANLFVLTTAFVIFATVKHDSQQFSLLSFISIGLGLFTSFFFLCTVPEKRLSEDCSKFKKILEDTADISQEHNGNFHYNSKSLIDLQTSQNQNCQEIKIETMGIAGRQLNNDLINFKISEDIIRQNKFRKCENNQEFLWRKWFSLPSFYIYGLVYMGSRISVNVQSSLIIFYLQTVLGIARGANIYSDGVPFQFALIPMLIYLSSTIASIFIKQSYEKFGRKKIYIFGVLLSISSAVAMMVLSENSANWMYGFSVLIGISQSICLNTAITLISEVVGVRGSNAAFVFGAYSLLDKFANGFILYAIMNIHDISSYSNILYTRICSSVIPASGAVLACFFVLIGNAKDYDSGDLVTEGLSIKSNPRGSGRLNSSEHENE